MITNEIHISFFQVAAVLYLMSLLSHCCKRERWAVGLLLTGFTAHSCSQLMRCWRFGFFTLEGAFQIDYFLPWSLAAMILLHLSSQEAGRRPQVLTALWPLAVSSLIAFLFPPSGHAPTPFTPTWTAYLFFIFEALAHACFILSGWRALEFLTRSQPEASFNGYAVWGFVFYSLAQLTGCAWAYLGWGGLFHWGTRHIHSAALWCCYCSYLHTPFIKGFYVRKRAGFALGGSLLAVALFFVLPIIPKNVAQVKKPLAETVSQQSASLPSPQTEFQQEGLQ